MIEPISLDNVPRVTAHEAKALLDAGSALFIDVRKREEYRHGHIPTALSIPASGAPSRYWALPADRYVVLY